MASVIDKNLQPAPLQEALNDGQQMNRAWQQFFIDIADKLNINVSDIDLNTTHRSSDGTDHAYIDQDVTINSSPVFSGLTVDSRDLIRYMYLVAN